MGSLTVNLDELPLELSKVSRCQNLGCMLLKHNSQPQLIFKNTMELANLALGLYFFRLVKRSVETIESGTGGGWTTRDIMLKNRVVKALMIMEILFNVIPNLASYTINVVSEEPLGCFPRVSLMSTSIQTTGITAGTYFGSFSSTFLCISDTLSSWFYTWNLLRPKTELALSTAVCPIKIVQNNAAFPPALTNGVTNN